MEAPISEGQIIRKGVLLKNSEKVEIPTIHIDRMRLYHGSPVNEITAFKEANEDTIGRGVYFTTDRKAAKRYAVARSNGTKSRVYEVEVSNLDIADLRTRAGQEAFARLFKQSLLDWKEDHLPNLKGPSDVLIRSIREQREKAIKELIEKIDDNSFKHLRDLTFAWGDLVSKTLSSLGYNGLISIEGEPPQIDFHDSVVIFNPQNVKIIDQKPE